ncbi:MAG: hypothetical protein WD688_03970 [Candidatus Binatia bacterium]
MDSKELIEIIRTDVATTKEKGLSSIPVENLLAYLNELEKNPNHPANQLMSAAELERYKTELAMWLTDRTELFRSVILAGQSALKSAILINGGAAVALLAFIGHVWKPDMSSPLKELAGPLVWFVAGVLLDAMAAGLTYVSQCFYASCGDSRGKLFTAGATFHVLTVLLVLASYGTFAYATCLVYSALVK